jgi:hypothetical protein
MFTSFYGYDASERITLARWGTAYRRLFRKGAAFVASRSAHACLRSSRSLYDRVSGVQAKVGPTANELA